MLFSGYILNENMSVEDIDSSVEKGVEYFKKEIKKLFPDFMCTVGLNNSLGTNVAIHFSNLTTAEAKSSNTAWHNATGKMIFMMHLSDGGGKRTEMSKFSIDKIQGAFQQRDAGIKFRLISGKSPEETLKKLIEWFKKNKELIDGLEKKVI
jgi:guanyl-specific ribonuclease Sa